MATTFDTPVLLKLDSGFNMTILLYCYKNSMLHHHQSLVAMKKLISIRRTMSNFSNLPKRSNKNFATSSKTKENWISSVECKMAPQTSTYAIKTLTLNTKHFSSTVFLKLQKHAVLSMPDLLPLVQGQK